MKTKPRSEKGQAIVLIVFGIIGMFALVALAMDGGQAFSDRRQAQNAADAASMAAALYYQKTPGATDTQARVTALERAASNGYANSLPRSTVTFTATPAIHLCPKGGNGKDFKVTIDSYVNTWFAGIVGIQTMHNTVSAVARGCEYYWTHLYEGSAMVGLAPMTCTSLSVAGNSVTRLECKNGDPSGGAFSNGNANGAGSFIFTGPSLAAVGSDLSDFTGQAIPQFIPSVTPYAYPLDVLEKQPRIPLCDGIAQKHSYNGQDWYYPQPGTDGSIVPALNGGQRFRDGIFCVYDQTNNWSGGTLTAENSTFFILKPDYNLKFAGGGGGGEGFDISATISGEYQGFAIVLPLTCFGNPTNGPAVICDPIQVKTGQQTVKPCGCPNVNYQTPSLDLRGNGVNGIVGTVLAPSACVTLFGNSFTENHGQIIGYMLSTGGGGDVNICYDNSLTPPELHEPTVEQLK